MHSQDHGRLCAEVPSEDEEELSDMEAALDVALPAFMGESRAQLMRSQEMLRGQLTAKVLQVMHCITVGRSDHAPDTLGHGLQIVSTASVFPTLCRR